MSEAKSKVGLSESMNEFKEMFDINFFNAVLVSKTLIPMIKNNNSNNKTITFISSLLVLNTLIVQYHIHALRLFKCFFKIIIKNFRVRSYKSEYYISWKYFIRWFNMG